MANPSPSSLKVFPPFPPFPPLVNPSIEQSADDTIGASLPPVNISIVARLSGVRFFKNVFNPLKISFQEILLNAVVTASNTPCAHELSVLANNAKSKFWKNLFIPSAMEFPNCFQLKVVPNESNP